MEKSVQKVLEKALQDLDTKENNAPNEKAKMEWQLRKAQILLNIPLNDNELANYLARISDDYMRAQIVLSHVSNNSDYRFQSAEEAQKKILRYCEDKKVFLDKENEDGQLGFLLNPLRPSRLSEIDYKDENEKKKSLMNYFKEGRRKQEKTCRSKSTKRGRACIKRVRRPYQQNDNKVFSKSFWKTSCGARRKVANCIARK